MHRTTVKITRYSVHILSIRDFSRQILRKKIFKIPNFVKIRPVGDQSFHADRRIDMTKLTVASRKFTNAPKNGWCLYLPLFLQNIFPYQSVLNRTASSTKTLRYRVPHPFLRSPHASTISKLETCKLWHRNSLLAL
jgi:hypothetical protein